MLHFRGQKNIPLNFAGIKFSDKDDSFVNSSFFSLFTTSLINFQSNF